MIFYACSALNSGKENGKMYDNGLEAFLAIVRHGGFLSASHHLNLTQSTVSHRLMELEGKIGARLLERGKDFRKVELTSTGIRLLPLAEKWLELTEEIQDITSEERTFSLAIITVDTVNAYIFPPLYALLSRNRVNLKISSRKSSSISSLIEKREFDVGYAFQVHPTPNTVIRELFREKIVLLRPSTNGDQSTNSDPVDNKSLNPEDEIYFDTWGPGYELWHAQWWGSNKTHRLEIDTPSVFNSLANSPNQWSLVPWCMARYFVNTGKFVIQPLQNPPPIRICYEIRNRHVRYNAQPALQLLQRFMEDLGISSSKEMQEMST
jgi:DNA-binding transcriptional LysR family regulator